MTLVEFLRAREAEREATALKAAERDGKHWTAGFEHVGSETTSYIAVGPWEGPLAETGEHMALHDPAWVLADVESKRRILRDYEMDVIFSSGILRLLALPYTAHPDYRQEWAV